MSEMTPVEQNNLELAPFTNAERVQNTVDDLLKMHEEEPLHGKTIDRDWFTDENRIGKQNASNAKVYGFLLAAVKREMERNGLTFTAKGFNDQKYRFYLPHEHASVMKNGRMAAIDRVLRMAILGQNTPVQELSEHQKLIHEHSTLKTLNMAQNMRRDERRRKFELELSKGVREIADSGSQSAIA